MPRLLSLFEWEEDLRGELIEFLRTEILDHASDHVTAAYLFGSAAEGGMMPASDIDVAVLHVPCSSEIVTAVMQEIAESVEQRFGNRLSFVLADSPPEEIQKSRRAGNRLWRRILREGIPILDPEARARG